MRTIHLATGNAHKVAEFQRLADASGLGLRVVAAGKMPEVVEDTGTFAGNARKKAAALRAVLPPDAWVLADDSGVCVDALDGAPGVESAYFAGPEHDAGANLRKLTEVMRAVLLRGAGFGDVWFQLACLAVMGVGILALAAFAPGHEIVPLLKKHCAECHAGDKKKGGFSFNTRADLLEGSENGPVITKGSVDKDRKSVV